MYNLNEMIEDDFFDPKFYPTNRINEHVNLFCPYQLKAIKDSWPGAFDDLEYQKRLAVPHFRQDLPKAVQNFQIDPEKFFDLFYLGALYVCRYGAFGGLFEDHYLRIHTKYDLLQILELFLIPNEDYTLSLVGADKASHSLYYLLFPLRKEWPNTVGSLLFKTPSDPRWHAENFNQDLLVALV